MSHTNQIIRWPKVNMTSYSLNSFHLRNPWVIAWWSLTFPGFGHIACGSMAKGIFVFVSEIIINYMAKINLAILYSFTGEFQKSKDVLNTQWLLLYCGILVFSIWDSYRLAVEFNKFSVLGDREYSPLSPTAIGTASINAFEKRNPWVAIAWSLFGPGLGQLYTAETIKAIFLLMVTSITIVASHCLQSIGFTAVGDYQQAKTVLDWEIFLNIPSFYGFAIWDSYVNAIEINKLFDMEQAQYFKKNFQDPNFNKPLPIIGG